MFIVRIRRTLTVSHYVYAYFVCTCLIYCVRASGIIFDFGTRLGRFRKRRFLFFEKTLLSLETANRNGKCPGSLHPALSGSSPRTRLNIALTHTASTPLSRSTDPSRLLQLLFTLLRNYYHRYITPIHHNTRIHCACVYEAYKTRYGSS